MKIHKTTELPENCYGWNGDTLKYIGKFTDIEDIDEAAKKTLPNFDMWWIFTDDTLQDIAAQANALLSEHADHTVGPVHFPNHKVAVPCHAQVWEVSFLEKQGERKDSESRYVFGTYGQVEKWANAELVNYYGGADGLDDDEDPPELDEDGWIDDGWVRKATISSISEAPTVEIVNLCGPEIVIDLNHPQYTAIPGPYDYITTGTPA